jgi:hypothetical protein
VDPVPDPLLFFLVVSGIEPGPSDLQPRTLTTRTQRRSFLTLQVLNFVVAPEMINMDRTPELNVIL